MTCFGYVDIEVAAFLFVFWMFHAGCFYYIGKNVARQEIERKMNSTGGAE